MKKIFYFIVVFILIHILQAPSFAMKEGPPSVAVFGLPQKNNNMLNSLTIETISDIRKIFDEAGRFVPVENVKVNRALEEAEKDSDMENIFENISRLLDADIYIVIGLYQIGNITYADLRVFSLNSEYKKLERKIVLRSAVLMNISIKILREIACLHKGLPVSARIEKIRKDNMYIINAGQWHGIYRGFETATDIGKISVVETGRYESLISVEGGKKNPGDTFNIDIYPETSKIILELESRLRKNTIKKHSLENILPKGDNPEKKLLESMCIANIGGNICLPGYASYLTTGYMGFDNPAPSIPGIAVSAATIIAQLSAPCFFTGFNANFFPWIKDSDKNDRMQNLQIFLWTTLPVTYTVSYLDQLSFQFHNNQFLPPFFEDMNNAAAGFSVIIPGGGFFYKGYRIAGWSFYFSEMLLAGYGIYTFSSVEKRNYIFIALGTVKLLDIIGAYFIKSSYDFFNLEQERKMESTSFNIGIMNQHDDSIYSLTASYLF